MSDTFLGRTEVFWVGVQALSAIVGLVALGWYAVETRLIRRGTLAQSDASRRPFLFPDSENSDEGIVFKNSGSGPALKLEAYWVADLHSSALETIGSIGVGGTFTVNIHGYPINRAHVRLWGLRITCEDLAGKKYWTTFSFDGTYYDVQTGVVGSHLSLLERIERWNRTLEGE